MAVARPAGYKFLTEKFQIKNMRNWCSSNIGETRSIRHTITEDGFREDYYPSQNWPGDTVFDHLEFAIKNEGVNLAILRAVFPNISDSELASFIAARPLSKHRRKIWFLYEFLLGTQLPLADMENKGNYIELLDPEEFYTSKESLRSSRHRIELPLFS